MNEYEAALKNGEITPIKTGSSSKKRGIFDPSILEHRQKLSFSSPTIKAVENILFYDLLIPIENDIKIPVRMYVHPEMKNEQKIPTLFYVPNTGFVATETKFTHVTCTHLCNTTKCQVIVINHRLAPENQYPAGVTDAYNVFKHFAKDAPNRYSIDREKIVIAGYSSGGNFAALIAIRAIQDGIYLRKQILISPIVDLSRSLPGFKTYEDKDTDISDAFVHWVVGLYLPPDENPKNPAVSPFWKNGSELKGLPSTDIIFAEFDRCRSDSEYYFIKLKKEDVPVERFMAPQEKHSYLWHNIEVTEKFSEHLMIAFSDAPIYKSLPNTLSHIHVPDEPENEKKESLSSSIKVPKL